MGAATEFGRCAVAGVAAIAHRTSGTDDMLVYGVDRRERRDSSAVACPGPWGIGRLAEAMARTRTGEESHADRAPIVTEARKGDRMHHSGSSHPAQDGQCAIVQLR